MKKNTDDKIVLFAKPSGCTSFSSLFSIKHAFSTKKVGHTGTLDSFASGLLVVCCNSLTKLAGKITEFDKSYEAVIKFGEETDTLECTGKVVARAKLPLLNDLENSVERFTGELLQTPPAFSAIHIDGKRASDIVRKGLSVEIPKRKIKVYSAKILEVKQNFLGEVEYARISFCVSKGTYLRSLARDIGIDCKSRASLVGLLRTSIGQFELKNAAGYEFLPFFNIENSIKNAEKLVQTKKEPELNKIKQSKELSKQELELQKQIREKSMPMDCFLAKNCGFSVVHLLNSFETSFKNGVKLSFSNFLESKESFSTEFIAVFSQQEDFLGLIQKEQNGKLKYSFVLH